jgi:hypothetical protein
VNIKIYINKLKMILSHKFFLNLEKYLNNGVIYWVFLRGLIIRS